MKPGMITYTNEYLVKEPAFYYDECRTKDDVDSREETIRIIKGITTKIYEMMI